MSLFRTKPISDNQQTSLNRCLSGLDLTLLGVGAIVGAGIFVLTGIAAATKAGPAISLSYILAGFACLFTALSYAELAASVGGSGSAYTYAYSSFGEIIAWMMGWALILEYTVAISSVAIGWSGYVNNALQALNIHLPQAITMSPKEGGWINLPATGIIVLLTLLLCSGVKHSARFNTVIVVIKLIAIAIFIGVASRHVQSQNWHPFMPFGWQGIANGAALVFFSFIGFDAVSTAAEETINPQKNLPIGIVGSLFICTILYVIVAILLTGIANYSTLNVPSPVSDALLQIGQPLAAGLTSIGAIAGLTTVMLVVFFGLTRIVLAISRAGLLPLRFSKINPGRKTPIFVVVFCGTVIALIAGFMPLNEAAELVNIGTLAAFTLVCSGVVAMRLMHPDLPRPFKVPFNPIIPVLGVIFCIYLMMHLPAVTWQRFLVWLLIGLIIYFAYGRRNSVLQKAS